jgi:hypothetical protein
VRAPLTTKGTIPPVEIHADLRLHSISVGATSIMSRSLRRVGPTHERVGVPESWTGRRGASVDADGFGGATWIQAA